MLLTLWIPLCLTITPFGFAILLPIGVVRSLFFLLWLCLGLLYCFASAQTAIEHLDGALVSNKPLQIHPMRNHHRKTNPELLSVLFSSHSSASISHLRKFFTTYGPIASVSEYTHHKGDRFGFVNFENPEDAARAARDAPNHTIFNRHFKLYGYYADAADMLDGDQVDLKQLHVRKLDKAITDHSLKALFFTYGCLFSCKVLRDPNGTSTGSGLVAFATNKEASRALRAMNGEMILGKTLRITLEKRRESRSKMLPLTMTPQTPPMYPNLLMSSPGGFGLGFGQQMFTPCGFGQQMFHGQTAPTLFSPEPGHWYQQQVIPGVTLPAGAPMPNTLLHKAH